MSDDTDELPRHQGPSVMDALKRIPFILGVIVMLWLLLAKNVPSLGPTPQNNNPAPAPPTEPVAAMPPAPAAPIVAPPAPDISRERDKEHIAKLEEQVTRLSGELSALKAQVNSKKDDEQLNGKLRKQDQLIDSMKEQVEALRENDAQRLTAITAFDVMKEAALQGEPFEDELKQVASLTHDPQQQALLAPLQPLAAKGIPTLATLQSQFDELLPTVLSSGRGTGSLSSNIVSLIRIRKEGEQQQGTDDEAVLARAEAKIHRGELNAGIRELQALSPPSADAMAGWVRNTRDYMDGHKALDALQVELLKDKPVHVIAKPEPAKPEPEMQAKPEPEPKPAVKAAEPPAPVALVPVEQEPRLDTDDMPSEIKARAATKKTAAPKETEDSDSE